VRTIDVDQHIFETRTTWLDHIDPGARDDALAIEDDELGWAWLTWRGACLQPVESQRPGQPQPIGAARIRRDAGLAPEERYDDAVPAAYVDPGARLRALDEFGIDAAVLFPNFGLIWEDLLAGDVPALCANLTATNRWQAENAHAGGGRLFPVGHVTLRDVDWAVREVTRLGRDGVRLAMLAPAAVAGRPLSHPDFHPFWQACIDSAVAPVFHVGNFTPPFDPAWYTEPAGARGHESGDHLLSSIFLWVPPALAIADLVLNGTFDAYPELRLGVVELTCGWLPSFLLALDGASDFWTARHGRPFHPLALRPSEYVVRNVRVAALAYERPARLARHYPDTLMYGSDWPHAEGIVAPLADYESALVDLDEPLRAHVLADNAKFILHLD